MYIYCFYARTQSGTKTNRQNENNKEVKGKTNKTCICAYTHIYKYTRQYIYIFTPIQATYNIIFRYIYIYILE